MKSKAVHGLKLEIGNLGDLSAPACALHADRCRHAQAGMKRIVEKLGPKLNNLKSGTRRKRLRCASDIIIRCWTFIFFLILVS